MINDYENSVILAATEPTLPKNTPQQNNPSFYAIAATLKVKGEGHDYKCNYT